MKIKNQSTKLRYAIALALGLGINQLALAVGLGPIQVSSYLGQPLKATIRVDGLSPQTAERTVVRLAGADAYRARGVRMEESHQRLAFQVKPAGDGFVIHVTSNGEIKESFLNFLVTVNGDSGVITREYSVFLEENPAGNVAAVAAPVQSASPAPSKAPTATGSAQHAQPAVQLQAPAAQPAPIVAQTEAVPVRARPAIQSAPSIPASQTEALATARTPAERAAALVSQPVNGVYGPVKSGETLYSIANALRPHNVTVQQMMNAIHTTNRHAFSNRNHNSLMVGAMLTIPEVSSNGSVKRGSRQNQTAPKRVENSVEDDKNHPVAAKPAEKTVKKEAPKQERKPEPKPAPAVVTPSEEASSVTVYRASEKHGAVVHIALDGAQSALAMPEAPAVPAGTETVETTSQDNVSVEVEVKPAETAMVEEKPAETTPPAVTEPKAEEAPVTTILVNEGTQDSNQAVLELKLEPLAPVTSTLQLDSVSTIDAPATQPAEEVPAQTASLETVSSETSEETPKSEESKPAEPAVIEPVTIEVKTDTPAEPPKPVEPAPVETKPAESTPAEPAPVQTPPAPPPTPAQTPAAPVTEEVVDEGLPLPLIAGGGALGLLGLGGLAWYIAKRRRAKPYVGEEILEDLSAEELAELEGSVGRLDEDFDVKADGEDFDLTALNFDSLQAQVMSDDVNDDFGFSQEMKGNVSQSALSEEQDDDFLNDLLSDPLDDQDDFFHTTAPVLPLGQENTTLFGDIDVELEDDGAFASLKPSEETLDFGDAFEEPHAVGLEVEPAPALDDWNFDAMSLGDDNQVATPLASAVVAPIKDIMAEPVALQYEPETVAFEGFGEVPSFVDLDESTLFTDTAAIEVATEQDDEMFIDFNTGSVELEAPVLTQSALSADVIDLEDGSLSFGKGELFEPAIEAQAPVFVEDSALSLSNHQVDFFDTHVEEFTPSVVSDVNDLAMHDDLFAPSVMEESIVMEEPAFVTEEISVLEPAPVVTPVAKKVEVMEQDLSINLELANSFIATGRPERARTWLEEVVALGTADQKVEAERLLKQISAS